MMRICTDGWMIRILRIGTDLNKVYKTISSHLFYDDFVTSLCELGKVSQTGRQHFASLRLCVKPLSWAAALRTFASEELIMDYIKLKKINV